MPAVQEIGSLFARPATKKMLPSNTTRMMRTMGVVDGGSRRYQVISRSPVEFTYLGYKGHLVETCLALSAKRRRPSRPIAGVPRGSRGRGTNQRCPIDG